MKKHVKYPSTHYTAVVCVKLLLQREKYLPRVCRDAVFYLNYHNIKLLTRDSNEVRVLITAFRDNTNAACPAQVPGTGFPPVLISP